VLAQNLHTITNCSSADHGTQAKSGVMSKTLQAWVQRPQVKPLPTATVMPIPCKIVSSNSMTDSAALWQTVLHQMTDAETAPGQAKTPAAAVEAGLYLAGFCHAAAPIACPDSPKLL
jgi:hypothetical protein